MSLLRRLLNLGRSERLSRDIEREISFHLRERIEELREQGISEAEAVGIAKRQFGNPTFQRERTRDADIVVWLDSIGGDVRYAVRALRRTPAFTIVAIASLALGIGANTAIYSLIDAVSLRPLPVPQPEELVRVAGEKNDYGIWTNPLWEAIRDRQTGLAQVAAFSEHAFVVGAGGEERRLNGELVSGDYFRLFGMQPALGRLTSREDDVRGCPATAVLSYGFWQREYGGRTDVIGRTITLESKPFEIVGVTRPGFTVPEVGRETQLFVPICAKEGVQGPGTLDNRSNWWLRIMGRREATMTLAQVAARLKTIARDVYASTLPQDWGARSKQSYLSRSIEAIPAPTGVSDVRRRYSKALVVMMGAVALVLLIACANVANLLLARGAARQREVAIRLAVGASRRRLMRQLLTESALLAGAGAVLGLFVAQLGSRGLVALIATPDVPLALDTSFNMQMLLFTALVATLTATLFGLMPAWRGTRISPQAAMKAGGRGIAEGGHVRFTLGKSLVAAQVALSLTLLVGSALFIGTLRNLDTLDPGFTARGIVIVDASFRRTGLPEGRLATLPAELLERVRHLPGVWSASRAEVTPISCCSWNDELVVQGFTPKNEDDAVAWMNRVSDSYFQTMGTQLLAGRDFDATDVLDGPKSAIVNESFAKKFFHAASPVAALGRQFRTRFGDKLSDPYTVVGVVENAKYTNLRETNSETAYLAESQERARGNAMLEVRSEGDPMRLVPALKALLAEMHPASTVSFTRLETQVARSLQRERVLAVLSGLFGAIALALAMLGLYGVMTYTVARRRSEIGVRIALGADRSRVLQMVLGDVARVVAVGLVIGAAGALGAGRLVTSFLYGLTPSDPSILALAAALLAAVALGAGLAPALRASRVDPVAALRED